MALYNKYFYNSHLKNYTIAFGSLFNNIHIQRKNGAGDVLHDERVPLAYANKQKYYVRLQQDGNLDKKSGIKLPRMGFSLNSIQYAPDRKTNSRIKIKQNNNDNQSAAYTYNGLPYDLSFGLYIFSKSQDVGMQIVEQILPFFTPDYTIALKSIDNPEINIDVPINLRSTNIDADFEGEFTQRTTNMWELEFLMRAYIFGPVRTGGLIKTVNTEIYDGTNVSEQRADGPDIHMAVQPHIDGVALSDIEESDDWEVSTTINEAFNE